MYLVPQEARAPLVLKHQAQVCLAHAVLTYPLDTFGKLVQCFSQQGLCVDGTLQTLCWKGSSLLILEYPSFPAGRETHHSNGPAATAHHRLLRLFPKVICHWDSSWPPPQLRDSPHPPLTKMRNVRHFPLSSVHGLRL